MQFEYHIKGMHCAACIEKIKAALSPHFTISELTLSPPVLKIEADRRPLLSDLNQYISLAGDYTLYTNAESPSAQDSHDNVGLRAYYPLILIAAYITGVASINNLHAQGINWQGWMNQLMAGFFLVFSAFKLLDLPGFADGYSTYDLLARRWYAYGYIYPFLELSLGILYLTQWTPALTYIATIIIMGFSSLGVINSLIKKQTFKCACLGTVLKVPLSSVTLIEDMTMVLMAVVSLVMS